MPHLEPHQLYSSGKKLAVVDFEKLEFPFLGHSSAWIAILSLTNFIFQHYFFFYLVFVNLVDLWPNISEAFSRFGWPIYKPL